MDDDSPQRGRRGGSSAASLRSEAGSPDTDTTENLTEQSRSAGMSRPTGDPLSERNNGGERALENASASDGAATALSSERVADTQPFSTSTILSPDDLDADLEV